MGIADGSMWDAAVVGAGPAGAICALLLARRGWRVVLLEKSAWPREKVCGGCVNASAVRMLHEIGVGDVLCGGTRLDQFSLHVGGKRLEIPLPEGIAIDRMTLDTRITAAAERAGATFLPRSAVRLGPANPRDEFRHLTVMNGDHPLSLHARVVLACDGIAGTLLQSEPWAEWSVARDAWFGVATLINTPGLVDGGDDRDARGAGRLRRNVVAARQPPGARCGRSSIHRCAGWPGGLQSLSRKNYSGMPMRDARNSRERGLLTRKRRNLWRASRAGGG